MTNIPLSNIDLDPENPRRPDYESASFQEGLDELSDTILELGVIEPIIVKRKSEDRYELIAGERRFLASQKAGLSEIPAVIREYSAETEMFVKIAENISRESMKDEQIWASVKKILEAKPELTRTQIAKRLGRSPSYINRIELLCENEEYKGLVEKGLLAPSMVFQAEAFRNKEGGTDKWERLVSLCLESETPITARMLKKADENLKQDMVNVRSDTPDEQLIAQESTPIELPTEPVVITKPSVHPIDFKDRIIPTNFDHHVEAYNVDDGSGGITTVLMMGGVTDEEIDDETEKPVKKPTQKTNNADEKANTYKFSVPVGKLRLLCEAFGIAAEKKTDKKLREELQQYLNEKL